MIEDASTDKGENDPFADKRSDKVDLDGENAKRKMAEAVNQHTLSFIADVVRNYRSTIRQDGPNTPRQPASRPLSK